MYTNVSTTVSGTSEGLTVNKVAELGYLRLQSLRRYTGEMENRVMSTHFVHFSNSGNMKEVPPGTVDLAVTSPPYPMIEMWDSLFSKQSPEVGNALVNHEGERAFDLMHRELDKSWAEVGRVLKSGGIACVNIGDAVRTLDDSFQLFSNHARIIQAFRDLGFAALPMILWRKETNKPNKYMGSGMLPVGAYVTLEHEFILILRKGQRRVFEADAKDARQKSAFFWEERNQWFSDIWEGLKGTSQKLNHQESRERSGAYPFELAYRLINMFSVMGDTVLDPFLGTGTTTAAAICACRNSIGYELDENLKEIIHERVRESVLESKDIVNDRLMRHRSFVRDRVSAGKEIKHLSTNYGFPVVTEQETEILLPVAEEYEKVDDRTFRVHYSLP